MMSALWRRVKVKCVYVICGVYIIWWVRMCAWHGVICMGWCACVCVCVCLWYIMWCVGVCICVCMPVADMVTFVWLLWLQSWITPAGSESSQRLSKDQRVKRSLCATD